MFLCPRNFPGKTTGSGLPFPSPGDLPDPEFKHPSVTGQFSTTELPVKPMCHGFFITKLMALPGKPTLKE